LSSTKTGRLPAIAKNTAGADESGYAGMERKMNCTLCGKPIRNYDAAYNHLEIDETHAADICPKCIDKFLKWQQSIYARLFPTSAVKKRFAGK